MASLIARRLGRIAFGCVLMLGLAYLVRSSTGSRDGYRPWHIAPVLTAIWGVAFAAHATVSAIATRLQVRGPADRWFAVSMMVPAAAIALTLPITLHMPLALLLSGWDGFDGWFEDSIVITGAAHVVAAFMIAGRARQLVVGKPAWSPRFIVGLTVVVSCIPFVVLMGIPPVLVWITALPFFPMLRHMAVVVERERLEMHALPEMLPEARWVS